jgi:hypothetical protein
MSSPFKGIVLLVWGTLLRYTLLLESIFLSLVFVGW